MAIIEALVPVKRLFLTLACCGARVDTRHPLLALEHYGPCMARLVAEDVGWKTQPTVRLSERYEPRDPTVRQPRARGAYLDPLVRFVNGSGHSKFLPWGRAIQMAGLSHAQNMSATTTLGGDSALSKAG
ncbi:hypothetical protein LT337_07275 [Mycolicibacterium fortuitum]|nr:hypothetical protein LT337_07275 [Mycolicibacterium fortuitum]